MGQITQQVILQKLLIACTMKVPGSIP